MHIENPVLSENDLYFVLMHGVNIVGAAHIEKTSVMKVVDLKCDNSVLEGYMVATLEQWIKSAINE